METDPAIKDLSVSRYNLRREVALEPKTNQELMSMREKHVPQGPFNVSPYFVDKAKGAVIYDVEGRELIDFGGGIRVMNVGHSHPKVMAAIKNQAKKYTHTCFHTVMYEPYVKLAEKLCALTPGAFPKMAMFANSGAEGVKNAVKIVRHYTKRPAIISFDYGFLGRTLLAPIAGIRFLARLRLLCSKFSK